MIITDEDANRNVLRSEVTFLSTYLIFKKFAVVELINVLYIYTFIYLHYGNVRKSMETSCVLTHERYSALNASRT